MCTYIHYIHAYINTYIHHQGSQVLNQVLNLVLSIPAFLVTKPEIRRGSFICFKCMFKFLLLLNLLCLFCKKIITYHKLKLHRIITKYCVLKVDFIYYVMSFSLIVEIVSQESTVSPLSVFSAQLSATNSSTREGRILCLVPQ